MLRFGALKSLDSLTIGLLIRLKPSTGLCRVRHFYDGNDTGTGDGASTVVPLFRHETGRYPQVPPRSWTVLVFAHAGETFVHSDGSLVYGGGALVHDGDAQIARSAVLSEC